MVDLIPQPDPLASVTRAWLVPQIGQHAAQFLQFAAQVFTSRDLADGQPQRGQLAGQILGVGLRLRGAPAILVRA